MARQLSVRVVGAEHPNEKRSLGNRKFEIALCVPGEPIELRPEPKNKHDPNAIAVFTTRGTQLGYVPAERAPFLRLSMQRAEVHAIFQEATSWGAVIRVSLDGSAPELPLERPAIGSGEDPGFYPDPTYDDDLNA